MRTITTEQAPSAKPVGASKSVPTDWMTIIDAPQYDVPQVGFSSSRRMARGGCEISSPLILSMAVELSELEGERATIDVRIVRDNGDTSTLALNMPVPDRDALMIPVQGQFLVTGDELQVRASEANAVDATVSYTEGQTEEDTLDVG